MSRIYSLLLTLVLLTGRSMAGETGAVPQNVATAMGKASEAKKNVLIEFFSYNSVESKMVRDNVLANPQVVPVLAEKVILVSVEQEKEKELSQRYGISRAPALVLISPEGKEIDRLLGNRTPEELLRLLQGRSGDKASVSELVAKAANPDAGVEAHLALADAFNRSGKVDQALSELTVCLDRSMASGPDRKYLKYVLTRLASLAVSYPQVQETLRARRDALEKNPAVKVDGVHVFFAINEALKEPNRNVDYYLKLSADSALRQQLFPAVFLQLVEARRYAEATGMVDLETFVNNAYPRQNVGHAHEHDGHDHNEAAQERGEQMTSKRVIDVTAAAVQALLATDHLEKAKRLTGRLLETYDTSETRQRLTQAAQRSGAKTAVDFTTWAQIAYPVKSEAKQPAATKTSIEKVPAK
jgi:Thioredoxin-like